ncbi:MAG: helix-turn-helix domain-containing protein [Propionicimonas sp.]
MTGWWSSAHDPGRDEAVAPASRTPNGHVALRQFAELGFPGTTIRSVANAADVDPSLITHFFVNEDGLFSASVDGLLDELRPQMVAVLSSALPLDHILFME